MNKEMKILDRLFLNLLTLNRKSLFKLAQIVANYENKFSKRIFYKSIRKDPDYKDKENVMLQEIKPVFTLSTGRCGTMTLAALMNLSSYIDAFHEPEPKLIYSSYLAFMNNNNCIPLEYWKKVVAHARDAIILKSHYSGRTYFETNNRITLMASFFIDCYPSSRFVHLYRHPYDFVRSAIRRKYYSGHRWDFARIKPDNEDPYKDKWKDMSQLEKCAWLWNKVNVFILDTLSHLPPERKFFLKSEDLFKGENEIIESLYKFASEAPLPSERKVKRLLNKQLNRQLKGDYPQPSKWSVSQTNSVKSITEKTMKKLGYEE